jgi:hypothetical protein
MKIIIKEKKEKIKIKQKEKEKIHNQKEEYNLKEFHIKKLKEKINQYKNNIEIKKKYINEKKEYLKNKNENLEIFKSQLKDSKMELENKVIEFDNNNIIRRKEIYNIELKIKNIQKSFIKQLNTLIYPIKKENDKFFICNYPVYNEK